MYDLRYWMYATTYWVRRKNQTSVDIADQYFKSKRPSRISTFAPLAFTASNEKVSEIILLSASHLVISNSPVPESTECRTVSITALQPGPPIQQIKRG